MYQTKSSLGFSLGLLVAGVAILGTQMLGWKWGDSRLVPTLIGIIAAATAVLIVYRSR